MGTVTKDELSVEAQQSAGQGKQYTPDEIAALLERWRARVLSEMGRRRLWRGASTAELEDQFQDVALVLCSREFQSEEHLRRALWTGLGFRARDFWKAARRREIPVGEFFEEIIGDDRLAAVEDAAATAADQRQVTDCLAELDAQERVVYKLTKGEGLSRRRVGKHLGLSEAEVLRVLYRAQRKIDQVAVLVVAGRLCGRRLPAIRSLARGQARGLTLEQARAHIAHCQDCLLAFREERAALSHRVAALLPLPVVASQDGGAGLGAVVEQVRGLPGAARRQLYELAGRSPGGGGEEAIVGTGGLAIGTKVAVTLCVGAAAGGGAICVNQLGGSPGTTNKPQPAERAKVREKSKPRAVKAAQVEHAPQPATESDKGSQSSSSSGEGSASSAPPQTIRKEAPQEFFPSGNSPAGGSGTQQSTPPSSAGSSSSGGSGGGSPQGGGGSGGEFFGG
jgi:RNA polymerase sigma factor (sigma-70 family)